ncbi:MFS transporter [Ktedonospora formicarum]|uniref:MFS transporter n=1 Tax=Ktedonospora formicarum TaxID=2778364 RepID=A0A8J3MTN8_9CHLR|nr:MFS transporter [Ktedonospora formicarum]GHO46121.1 MFS transporter [Ktedonospora formicarum]
MPVAVQSSQNIAARIDRLPLSREIWRILFLAGIAWLLESYDIGVIGTVLPTIERQFQLDTFAVGWLATISTLGIVVAIIPAGWLVDRVGRKNMLALGTAWYAFFSLLCAFAPNAFLIMVLRFVAGFGMGAIFPIPYAMAAEFTPSHARGLMTGVLDSFLSVGYFIAPLLGFAATSWFDPTQGWRFLFLLGGLPLLFVPVLLKWMPESPRWLQIRGRGTEADTIVSSLEDAIEQRQHEPLPGPKITSLLTSDAESSSPFALLRAPYLKRTIMMWISFACILFIFYAIQTYTPTVLVQQGYGLGNAFLFTSIIVIASIPGKYLAAYALERWGRKPTLIAFTSIAAVSGICFGFSHTVATSLFFGVLMSFFGIGVDPGIKIYGAEQYPTSIRGLGISSFECIGRLFGGALAPFIMAFILANGGVSGSYVFMAALAIIGVIAVALLGRETRGKTLERAATEDTRQAA